MAGATTRERQAAERPAAFFSAAGAPRAGGVRRALTVAWLATRAGLRRLRRQRPYNVLRIELSGELAEGEPGGIRPSVFGGGGAPMDLLTLIATLRTAREDPMLGLVLLDVHGLRAGWSRLQSLRRALLALRASGKRVWAYLSDAGMPEYYLASAADRVFLAPTATFDATGLASEVVFVKGALDKLGIEAQLARAGRFKSAGEPLTRTSMSAEHRAMLDELLDDLYAQLVGDVATSRHVDAETVRSAFERGPLLPADAVARGLVDAIAYPDEVEDALAERFGDPAPIDLGRYQRRRALDVRRAAVGAPLVGLLSVTGAIGVSAALPAGRTPQASSWRAFKRELAAFAEDRRVRAIVLRVDSPGGSGLASDLMWREVVQARRRKPVVMSMGDVAASGGYYLAAAADHVTAEGATLTGSIGVLAGKPVLRGLYDRLGITKELVVRGNAVRHSDYLPLDDVEIARLRDEAEAFYATFVTKVADGRHLTRDAVEHVAEGRVWSGRQALARGLVDALGGVERALEEVKQRLGIPLDSRVAIDRRPRARSLWRIARAATSPAGALAAELELVAPIVAGERLLAVMPFTVSPPSSASSALDAVSRYVEASIAEAVAAPRWSVVIETIASAVAGVFASRRPLVF